MIARTVFGIGLGLTISLNPYIVKVFAKDKKYNVSRVLGLSITLMNIGSITMSILSGSLGAVNWRYSFYIFFFLLVPIALVTLFLKEPERDTNTVTVAENATTDKKIRLTPLVILYMFLAFMMGLVYVPIVTNISAFIDQAGIGGPTQAGIACSMAVAGGIFAGLIYTTMLKTGRYLISIMMALEAIGAIIILYGMNIYFVGAGMFLIGIGLYMSLSYFTDLSGQAAFNDASIMLSTSLIWVFNYAGAYFCTYWVKLIEHFVGTAEVVKASFMATVFICATLAVIFIFINALPKTKKNEASLVSEGISN